MLNFDLIVGNYFKRLLVTPFEVHTILLVHRASNI
jgi:hypothetical protein